MGDDRSPVTLVWATPDIDRMVADIARVSSPQNVGNDATKLIGYLIRHKHWSPFELVSVCMEVHTTRDIGRQMLRHELRPQEFSQRYADVTSLGDPVIREARLKHPTNRQASVECDDVALREEWRRRQQAGWDRAVADYRWALDSGLAKECARVVLPEGNTPTVMYFAGPLRNWLHYCALRMANGTQPEHADVARAAWSVLRTVAPACTAAFEAETS